MHSHNGFWKGIYFKRENFVPVVGSNIFHQSKPILEELKYISKEPQSQQNVHILQNGAKSAKCIKSPEETDNLSD